MSDLENRARERAPAPSKGQVEVEGPRGRQESESSLVGKWVPEWFESNEAMTMAGLTSVTFDCETSLSAKVEQERKLTVSQSTHFLIEKELD